jgi:hypothetical protein
MSRAVADWLYDSIYVEYPPELEAQWRGCEEGYDFGLYL